MIKPNLRRLSTLFFKLQKLRIKDLANRKESKWVNSNLAETLTAPSAAGRRRWWRWGRIWRFAASFSARCSPTASSTPCNSSPDCPKSTNSSKIKFANPFISPTSAKSSTVPRWVSFGDKTGFFKLFDFYDNEAKQYFRIFVIKLMSIKKYIYSPAGEL